MNKKNRLIFAGVVLLALSLLSGCGCGKKKERDKTAEEVVKISITPEVTPTPVPEQVNPDAVVTNGNITMVNTYLVENGTFQSAKGAGEGQRADDSAEPEGQETEAAAENRPDGEDVYDEEDSYDEDYGESYE